MYDAIVVGSRCAGSSTARLLAEKGHEVLMVDRAHFPSDTVSTHCVTLGGVIQLRRWGLLDRVLDTNVPFIESFTLTIGPNEFTDPQPVEEGAGTVSPRRTVLDKVLVDAAVEKGAKLREGITVTDLVRDDQGGVVGIAGHDENGNAVDERAALVIGADGTHSFVAKAAGAEVYDERPGHGSGHYAYFSGMPAERVELAFNRGHFVGLFPTNDGQACVFAGKDDSEFPGSRDDVASSHAAIVAVGNPRLGESVRAATRESRFFAFRAIGFFRKPWGEGWALVGDAGYHKDPVTGHGITDAFRDAELLANAVNAGLDGSPMADALGGYQATRDEFSQEVYETTQQIASLDWTDDSLLEIFMRFGAAVTVEAEQIAAFS